MGVAYNTRTVIGNGFLLTDADALENIGMGAFIIGGYLGHYGVIKIYNQLRDYGHNKEQYQ